MYSKAMYEGKGESLLLFADIVNKIAVNNIILSCKRYIHISSVCVWRFADSFLLSRLCRTHNFLFMLWTFFFLVLPQLHSVRVYNVCCFVLLYECTVFCFYFFVFVLFWKKLYRRISIGFFFLNLFILLITSNHEFEHNAVELLIIKKKKKSFILSYSIAWYFAIWWNNKK